MSIRIVHPLAGNGILLTAQDEQESEQSLQLTRAMLYNGLNKRDESRQPPFLTLDFYAGMLEIFDS